VRGIEGRLERLEATTRAATEGSGARRLTDDERAGALLALLEAGRLGYADGEWSGAPECGRLAELLNKAEARRRGEVVT